MEFNKHLYFFSALVILSWLWICLWISINLLCTDKHSLTSAEHYCITPLTGAQYMWFHIVQHIPACLWHFHPIEMPVFFAMQPNLLENVLTLHIFWTFYFELEHNANTSYVWVIDELHRVFVCLLIPIKSSNVQLCH